MKEKLSPQEEKRLSYKKDHRTRTGESDRGMRKTWAERKARVNRKYRRKADAELRKAVSAERIDAVKEGDDGTTRELIRKGLTREDNRNKWGVLTLGETLKEQAKARVRAVGRKRKNKAHEIQTYMVQIAALEKDPSSPEAQMLLDTLQTHTVYCRRTIFGDCHLDDFYEEYPEWKKRLRAKLTELQKAEWKTKLKAEEKWKAQSPALRKPRAEHGTEK